MSDALDEHPDKRPDDAVSLAKQPSPGPAKAMSRLGGLGRGTTDQVKEPAPSVPLPKTIQWASYAIIAQVVFALTHALMARGFTPQLKQLMIDSNNKAKKPDKNFDALKHLVDYRKGLLFQGVLLGVAFILLAFTLRRARGASGARWGFLIISVLIAQTNGPLTLLPISDYPGALQVVRTGMGLASIIAIILLFLPASLQYFRDCKAATRPAGAPAKPGLGSLFGGRGAGGAAGGASGTARPAGGLMAGRGGLLGSLLAPRPPAGGRGAEPAAQPGSKAASDNAPRPKAKVRAEADAVAKGAELARARAKASKSRRVERS